MLYAIVTTFLAAMLSHRQRQGGGQFFHRAIQAARTSHWSEKLNQAMNNYLGTPYFATCVTVEWISMVYLFSPGGNVGAALSIGEQIRGFLKASTVAPTLFDRPYGQRACMSSIFPTSPLYFDTTTGRGDRRCDCASLRIDLGSGLRSARQCNRPASAALRSGSIRKAICDGGPNSNTTLCCRKLKATLKRMNFPGRLMRVMYATKLPGISIT